MSSPKLLSPPELAPLVSLRVRPGPGWADTAVAVGTGAACFVAQWVSVMLWGAPIKLSAVWLPGGLVLAVALLTEPRRWPAVVTAAAAGTTLLLLALRLIWLPDAILLSLLASLLTVALAAVLRAILPGPFALTTFREFLTYLITVVAGGVIVASILFLAGAAGLAIRPATFLVWRTFAFSVLLGYLLMTPTVVLLVREAKSFRSVATPRRFEAGLLGILLALACGLVFTGTVSRTATWTAFAMTLPPLLLWTAVRFGPLGASASLLFIAVFSTWTTSRGLGPFTRQSLGDNTLSLQFFILGTGLPLLGLAVVLGEQRRTAAALRSNRVRLIELTRELIAAREKEAAHIGRELHDDVGQRLALVSIGLSRLRQTCAEAAPGPIPDITELQAQTNSIARSLREISHRLYPTILEHVGLASALQLNCEEVRRATGMQLHLVNDGDTSAIPPDVALCLFRVAQGALSNVARHSGAHRIDLSLCRKGAELLFQITDDGRGFTPGAPHQATGLGLDSAAERVHSIGGTLTIDSAPGTGTTLRVTVPLKNADDASAADHPRG